MKIAVKLTIDNCFLNIVYRKINGIGQSTMVVLIFYWTLGEGAWCVVCRAAFCIVAETDSYTLSSSLLTMIFSTFTYYVV